MFCIIPDINAKTQMHLWLHTAVAPLTAHQLPSFPFLSFQASPAIKETIISVRGTTFIKAYKHANTKKSQQTIKRSDKINMCKQFVVVFYSQ